jgi:hypothetical protein
MKRWPLQRPCRANPLLADAVRESGPSNASFNVTSVGGSKTLVHIKVSLITEPELSQSGVEKVLGA